MKTHNSNPIFHIYYSFLIVAVLLCFNFNLLQAQNANAFSGSGRYYADIIREKSTSGLNLVKYAIRVYDLDSHKLIIKYPVGLNKGQIQELKLNDLGTMLYYNVGTQTGVLDLINSNLIANSYGGTVLFPETSPYFIQDYGVLKAIGNTGRTLVMFDKSNRPTHIGANRKKAFSYNDKYLVCQVNPRKVRVWDSFSGDLVKGLTTSNFSINLVEDQLVIYNRKKFYTYSFKTFRLVHKVDLKKILKDYSKQNPKAEVAFNKLSINPAGTICLIPVNQVGTSDILVFSTKNGILQKLNSVGNYKPELLTWINDTTVLIKTENNQFYKTTLGLNTKTEELFFKKSDNKNGNLKAYNRAKNQLINSPQYNYHAYAKKKKGMYYTGEFNQIKKHQPVVFTPNEKFLLLKTKNDRLASIDIKQGNSSLKYFSDSVVNVIDPYKEINPIAPPNYQYYKINNLIPIDSLKDSNEVKIRLKSITQTDSTVSLSVHLLDSNGNYYFGAAKENWKHIWCNLALKQSGKKTKQLTHFTVEEKSNSDTIPTAMVFVLDHSGSMGEYLANQLQNAAKEYVNNKHKKDIIAVIKYDNKVKLEANASTNSVTLTPSLQQNGLKGFGGSTSLLDAINKGVSVLRQQTEYNNKMVIAITDGYENSSRISASKITQKSYDENIQLHILGFGYWVQDSVLSSLAYNTGGSYYKIFGPKDFDWIFNDIDAKHHNYYNIKFHVKEAGKYQHLLKLCFGNQSDSLISNFTKLPSGFKDNNVLKQQYFEKVESPISIDTSRSQADSLYIKPLSDFSGVQVISNVSLPKKIFIDSLDYGKIDAEFEEIKFPHFKFKSNTDSIVKGNLNELDAVVEFLKKYPSIKIEVSGHTDNIGNDEANLILSQKRADKIRRIILTQKANPKQVVAVGYGENQPLVENNSDKNRAKNRRVIFSIIE